MSLTIGRRYTGPRRNYTDACSYCGVLYHRSELVLNAENLLACPDDRDGRTALEIDRQRAIDASEPSYIAGKRLTGPGSG